MFDGTRVSKADTRVEAYGDVDELERLAGRRARADRRRSRRRDAPRDSARSVRDGRDARRSAASHRRPRRKGGARRRRRHAPRALDRRARGHAAAAAPLHSRRRLAARRGAAPRAHRLPPRRAADRRPPGARRRRRAGAGDHLHQPAVGSAVRHGALGERAARRRRNSSGSRTPRTRAACDLARSHYENFPVASRLLPRALRPHVAADLRLCARRRRLRRRGRSPGRRAPGAARRLARAARVPPVPARGPARRLRRHDALRRAWRHHPPLRARADAVRRSPQRLSAGRRS